VSGCTYFGGGREGFFLSLLLSKKRKEGELSPRSFQDVRRGEMSLLGGCCWGVFWGGLWGEQDSSTKKKKKYTGTGRTHRTLFERERKRDSMVRDQGKSTCLLKRSISSRGMEEIPGKIWLFAKKEGGIQDAAKKGKGGQTGRIRKSPREEGKRENEFVCLLRRGCRTVKRRGDGAFGNHKKEKKFILLKGERCQSY